jgi:hypothetical protein
MASVKCTGNGFVVSPFECAWLTGELVFASGAGCVAFDCKGETDATVLLKAKPGGKRWQHQQDNYTVIFGSHRNSCLKLEKNGATVAMVRSVGGSRVSGKEFTRFWVEYDGSGAITVGTGDPSPDTTAYRRVGGAEGYMGMHRRGGACMGARPFYPLGHPPG